MELPKIILDVVDHFSKLPGVGAKTAQRYAMAISKWSYEEIELLSKSVQKLSELQNCKHCGLFADGEVCSICSSSRCESKTICIVESISDCMAIEKSGTYRGLYYILGGVLNPLMGIGPEELQLDKFISRVRELEIQEVILAINPSVEGDATCSFISQILPDSVSAQRIGFGIPMGGSLEYLDSMTISKALENKKRM